jgi:hypothetical protein
LTLVTSFRHCFTHGGTLIAFEIQSCLILCLEFICQRRIQCWIQTMPRLKGTLIYQTSTGLIARNTDSTLMYPKKRYIIILLVETMVASAGFRINNAQTVTCDY